MNYFAPDRPYSSDKSPEGPTREFQAMAKAFHDQGIKVFIDVVYNHTGEGYAYSSDPRTCNLMSQRGLDNPTYYLLTNDNQFPYDNVGSALSHHAEDLSVALEALETSLCTWYRKEGPPIKLE